jgi:hypothetical protein
VGTPPTRAAAAMARAASAVARELADGKAQR